jgi:hypothetical protein
MDNLKENLQKAMSVSLLHVLVNWTRHVTTVTTGDDPRFLSHGVGIGKSKGKSSQHGSLTVLVVGPLVVGPKLLRGRFCRTATLPHQGNFP